MLALQLDRTKRRAVRVMAKLATVDAKDEASANASAGMGAGTSARDKGCLAKLVLCQEAGHVQDTSAAWHSLANGGQQGEVILGPGCGQARRNITTIPAVKVRCEADVQRTQICPEG